MWKYALRIAYLGTSYLGWQRQGEEPTIQKTLEEAVLSLTQETVNVVGSGRTDSGVHAVSQVAHFRLSKKKWDPFRIREGLNAKLPQAIRVTACCEVSLDFHAQRSALKKQYSYYFQQGPVPLPHLSYTSWWIRKTLEIERMNQGLQSLVGRHDFKPFQASGSHSGPTIREISTAAVEKVSALPMGLQTSTVEFYLVRLRIVGSGFLKQMVRSIAGTALEVGEGKSELDRFAAILRTGDREQVGYTVPARGLWLERVWYPEGSLDWERSSEESHRESN